MCMLAIAIFSEIILGLDAYPSGQRCCVKVPARIVTDKSR